MHGVALIEAVIAKLTKDPKILLGKARPTPVPPEALANLTFPCGKPLSPALRRWLAFDAGWLGWFSNPQQPSFAPQQLGAYARQQYDMEWGYSALEASFAGECYGLAFGSDSRRFLYVGDADSHGEYPVLLLDTDDVPYLGVEYPGIDVYLGIHTGVIDHEVATYGDLLTHRVYGPRMKEHAKRYFNGSAGDEIFVLGVDPAALAASFITATPDAEKPVKPAKPQPVAAKKQVAAKPPAKKPPAKKPPAAKKR